MPICHAKYLGELEYHEQAIIRFPDGIPGFEHEREFLLIDRADLKPLVFVQSLHAVDVCLLALPILVACPDYRLQLAEADLETLELATGTAPRIGHEAACLAVVTFRETGATVNLLAPITINLRNRLAVQAISLASGYGIQQQLGVEELAAC